MRVLLHTTTKITTHHIMDNYTLSILFQPNANLKEVPIKQLSTYKIEFTALIKASNIRIMRAEVFKVR